MVVCYGSLEVANTERYQIVEKFKPGCPLQARAYKRRLCYGTEFPLGTGMTES